MGSLASRTVASAGGVIFRFSGDRFADVLLDVFDSYLKALIY